MTDPTDEALCAGFCKRRGKPCRDNARQGSQWCFNHDPELAWKRKVNGAKRNKPHYVKKPASLRTLEGIRDHLAASIACLEVDRSAKGAVKWQTLQRMLELSHQVQATILRRDGILAGDTPPGGRKAAPAPAEDTPPDIEAVLNGAG